MNRLQRIIRFPELKEIIGLSRARIYQMMEEQTFPRQIKLSARAIGWREKDIEKWLEEREVAR